MRKIGYDQTCFIIAEAGINHNGDLSIAKDMALAARIAGADAVKYQTFRPEELDVHYKNISYDQTILLKEYCDEIGIEFLSTPHSFSAIDALEPLVAAYKVASPWLWNMKFMDAILAKRKPVIVSFNEKARHSDIHWLMNYIYDIYPMHTVCRYPASDPRLNKLEIRMEVYWQRPWGYSDHCTGHKACLDAVDVGACMIEKHMKLVRDCPDAIHSITPKEFRDMVETIRWMEEPQVKTPCTD